MSPASCANSRGVCGTAAPSACCCCCCCWACCCCCWACWACWGCTRSKTLAGADGADPEPIFSRHENAQASAMNEGFLLHSPPAAQPTQFGSLSRTSPAMFVATWDCSRLTALALLSAVAAEPCSSLQSASAAAAAAASVPEHDSAHSEAMNVGFLAHSPLAAHPPQLGRWPPERARRLPSEGSSPQHSSSPRSALGP